MNKKILMIPIVLLAIIVTASVTSDKDSAEIVATKKRLLENIARKDEVIKKNMAPSSNTISRLSHARTRESDQRDEISPVKSHNTLQDKTLSDEAQKPVQDKTVARNKRISPTQKIISKSETKKYPGEIDRKNSPEASGGSATGFTGTPRTFVVTEKGEGETYLLMEALRLLNPGDKIQLKNGTYSLMVGHLSVPDIEMSGEGKETHIELPETLKLLQQNVTFKNLSLSNTSSSAAVLVRNDKRLIMENVELRGNGNDCVEINNGKIVVASLELQRCNRAILLKTGSTIEGSGLAISDSDYGIYSDSSSKQTVRKIKAENINLYSVFFASENSGGITCLACDLSENATNEKRKLILSNDP